MTVSPFAQDRFEYEHKHIYFLPQPLFTELLIPKSIYLVGTRGTGKTTILHALSAKEQAANPSLKGQLNGSFPALDYFGVYLKLTKFLSADLEAWLSTYDISIGGKIFSFYLEVLFIEAVLDSISELLASRHLNVSVASEYATTQRIIGHVTELRQMAGQSNVALPRLCSAFAHLREQIETWAQLKLALTPEELSRRVRLRPIGALGRDVFPVLRDLCASTGEFEGRDRLAFKVCLDEAEVLQDLGQTCLNTLVRLSEHPLFVVASYVRERDNLQATYLPNVSADSPDRRIKPLDEALSGSFRDFAQGVATVRIRDRVRNADITFTAETTLGKLDINRLLERILKHSESPLAREMQDAAEELSRTEFYRGGPDSTQAKPYYEAHVVRSLGIEIPEKGTPRWKRRSQESAEIRKRMVASYLVLCSRLNVQPKYAFAEMLFDISDRCIRDFLGQLDSLLSHSGVELVQFCSERIPVDIQNAALVKAAERKRDFVPRSGLSLPKDTARLLDALGKITAVLHSSGDTSRSLRSSERGRFCLDLPAESSEASSRIDELILEAAERGYLQLLRSDGNRRIFRVHNSLAPFYSFSYRGSYYEIQVSVKDLVEVLNQPDHDAFEGAVERLARRLAGLPENGFPLLELMEQGGNVEG
ncbi:MAG: hypothetical protein GC160_11580 [Acidobacteria bacterium]|nr:hypothetical protein [Acidobacteriota bacterium]